jgi:ubiquitin C
LIQKTKLRKWKLKMKPQNFPGLTCSYWLPDLLKHEFVALRFLPQASYEKAAQMRISPAPDVVTRVFMLFRGVAPGDLGLWEQAAARATAEDGGATFWARIVGVDLARALNRSMFRVLEWGGMEVK